MKKIIALFLSAVLVMGLAGCGENAKSVSAISPIDESHITEREQNSYAGDNLDDTTINTKVAEICKKSKIKVIKYKNKKSVCDVSIFLSFDEGSIKDNVKAYKEAIEKIFEIPELVNLNAKYYCTYLIENQDIRLESQSKIKNGKIDIPDTFDTYSDNDLDKQYDDYAHNRGK